MTYLQIMARVASVIGVWLAFTFLFSFIGIFFHSMFGTWLAGAFACLVVFIPVIALFLKYQEQYWNWLHKNV